MRSLLQRTAQRWPASAARMMSGGSGPAAALPATARAHIDFKVLKANVDYAVANVAARKALADPARAVQLYDEFVRLQAQVEAKRAARNELARHGGYPEARQAAGKQLKEELAALEAQLVPARAAAEAAGACIPCDTHPDSPVGPESAARTVMEVGARRQFDFTPKDHLSVGLRLGLFNFEAAAATSGSGFVTLTGPGVLLELALVQWALSTLAAVGFTPVSPPDVARVSVVEGCGFNPRDAPVPGGAPGGALLPSQVYSLAGTDLCLIGTSEIPLAGLHAGQVLATRPAPRLYAGLSHCFRHEAGGKGAATRGLYRLHQFTKVEMFAFVDPAQPPPAFAAPSAFTFPALARALIHSPPGLQPGAGVRSASGAGGPAAPCASSEAVFARLVDLQAGLYAALGLHARVLDMPSEELGASAYRKVDIEAWMPARTQPGAPAGAGAGCYGEVSSASNCIDYQARRLNIRFKGHVAVAEAGAAAAGAAEAAAAVSDRKEREPPLRFAHTLNATAVAVPRIMLALLETHQTPEGDVLLPPCLRPFLGGLEKLTPPAQ